MRAERRKAAEVRWHLVTVHLNPGPHGRTQEEKRRRREREVPEEEREKRGEGQAEGGGSDGGIGDGYLECAEDVGGEFE